jgi:hypothetical protein
MTKEKKSKKKAQKYIVIRNVKHDGIFYTIGANCPEKLVDLFLEKGFIEKR